MEQRRERADVVGENTRTYVAGYLMGISHRGTAGLRGSENGDVNANLMDDWVITTSQGGESGLGSACHRIDKDSQAKTTK